jgi:hypothetical protein
MLTANLNQRRKKEEKKTVFAHNMYLKGPICGAGDGF